MALPERIAGRQAAEALTAPFVLGYPHDLALLFNQAGVTSLRITTHNGRAMFPSIRSMVEADLRGWLPVMGVLLSEEQIETILQEAEQALSAYVGSNGRVAVDSPAIIVTAARPMPA